MIKKTWNVLRVVLLAVMILLPSLMIGHTNAIAAPTYYFGSDWDVRYPKYTYMQNYEDFYITKIGSGTTPLNGSLPATTLNGNPASSKYVYWFLCNNTTNNGAAQADAFYNTYQDLGTAVKNKYSSTFQGNTMFVDFEYWAGTCANWGTDAASLTKNKALVNSFLTELAARTSKKIGFYTGSTYTYYLGSTYTFPASLSGRMVIWYARYNTDCIYNGNKYNPATWPTSQWQALRTGVGAVATSWGMFTGSYKVGNINPTIWQYCGDAGDISPKNPVTGF